MPEFKEIVEGINLEERTMGGFPLSIGTALAFESVFTPTQDVFDSNRPVPERVDPSKYQSCWINFKTLFRNMQGAVNKTGFMQADPGEMTEHLLAEMEVIENLFQVEGKGLCKPVFYYSTYSKLKAKTTVGFSLREPASDGQKFYESRFHEVIKRVERQSEALKKFEDCIKPMKRERAFVLSHLVYDLVGFSDFDALDLLESHTGVLKPRALWNTKYSSMSGKSLAHIPFLRKLLLIFGDKYLIKPMPAPLRNQIIETASQRGWSAMTMIQKVDLDLSLDFKDPYMAAVYRQL